MICDRCGEAPIDILDDDGRGLCLACYVEVIEREELAEG
jgi:formylmethanofuran dehydrogenase subunit E